MSGKSKLLEEIEKLPGYIENVTEEQRAALNSAPIVEFKEHMATPDEIRESSKGRKKETEKLQSEIPVAAVCE